MSTPWQIIEEWREAAVRQLRREGVLWRQADEQTPDPRPQILAIINEHEAEIARLRAENERLKAALIHAFPHFDEDPERVTAERIRALGREYTEMIHMWAPVPNRIEFVDDDGREGLLLWDDGDPSVGLSSGWVLARTQEPTDD